MLTAHFRVNGDDMKQSTLIGAALAAFFIFKASKAQAGAVDTNTGAEVQPNLPEIEFTQSPVLPDVAYKGNYQDVQNMGNFTIEEFVASKTAAAKGIDNSLPTELLANAKLTIDMLEKIRAFLSYQAGNDIPIYIQSGYRNKELNAAVGGANRSDHLQAQAADWVAPDFGTPAEIAAALAPVIDDLGIGQLINEFPDSNGWVHTSIKTPANIDNRVITITRAGTTQGITA